MYLCHAPKQLRIERFEWENLSRSSYTGPAAKSSSSSRTCHQIAAETMRVVALKGQSGRPKIHQFQASLAPSQ